jgi:hypothetical protein
MIWLWHISEGGDNLPWEDFVWDIHTCSHQMGSCSNLATRFYRGSTELLESVYCLIFKDVIYVVSFSIRGLIVIIPQSS